MPLLVYAIGAALGAETLDTSVMGELLLVVGGVLAATAGAAVRCGVGRAVEKAIWSTLRRLL